MASSCVKSLLAALFMLSSSAIMTANAQISTPCTSSMIASFTPCLNAFMGSSPTKQCCNSLESLASNSMDCTCLIITGNVPVSVPFVNQNFAITLPRACKTSVPIQCKASGVPLPAPGPVLFGPTSAPIASAATGPAPQSHSPKASKAVGAAAPAPDDPSLDLSPASPPHELPVAPSAHPGIRPVVQPDSASNYLPTLLFSLVAIMIGISFF